MFNTALLALLCLLIVILIVREVKRKRELEFWVREVNQLEVDLYNVVDYLHIAEDLNRRYFNLYGQLPDKLSDWDDIIPF
jgi:hypothetical protein